MVLTFSIMVLLLALPPCWSLRKSKLRQMREQPVTPPAEIFDQVELTNEFQLGEQCTGSDWITDMAGAALSGKHYGACALVGTGGALAGKPGGHRLDGYDTVIRVGDGNGTLEAGSRTDVLFGDPVAEGVDLRGPEGYALYAAGGREVHRCAHDQGACPAGSVVLSAGIADAKQRFSDVYPRAAPGWKPVSSAFPLARQSGTVRWVLKHLEDLALHGKQPTPGLQAFFTFLPLCDMITLFGFKDQDIAGDRVHSSIHNVTAERKLLDAIADGQLPSQYLGLRDAPPALRRIEECLLPHFRSNAMMVLLHDDD